MKKNAAKEWLMEKKKWIKHLPLYLLELVVLAGAIGMLYFVTHATKAEKQQIREEDVAVNEEVKEQLMQSGDGEPSEDKPELTGVYQLALFGVDARDGSLGKGNRSDTIMICSIDADTHEVKLISIYRDTYLNIGNDSYNKCNAAYAKGGPIQAINMINMNTDLYLTDYITVGFEGLIKAVDALGGVELEVTEKEIPHLNNYQISMVGTSEDGVNFTAQEGTYIPVTEPGVQTLNGLQATAYCRIRYIGDDFQRAERQRNLITAMLEKSKTASFNDLRKAAEAVIPYISTSLDVEDILTMLSVVGDYEVTVSDGFPFAGMRNGGTMSGVGAFVVATDLDANVRKLHELLYDDADYEPSEELKSFSRTIEENTTPYLRY